MPTDRDLLLLFGGVFTLLLLGTVIAAALSARLTGSGRQAMTAQLMARIKSWWIMCVVFTVAVLSGKIGAIVLFALVSFLALREFVTVVPTAKADHRALFWVFFVVVPVQYALVFVGWYGLFVLWIPVYCFLLVPIRIAVAGDCQRFLERAAKIQWGMMACVYCVSHAPALLGLTIPNYDGGNAKLLLFFVIVVELCDICQYIWGKALGRHKILPTVSPNKTWEGFVGGCLTTGAVGAALWWATPFTPWQAFGMALFTGFLGFCGDVTMSAIKRDSNMKDYGELIPGHGGMLDRIDSLCFAAPFFFHITRYYACGASPVLF